MKKLLITFFICSLVIFSTGCDALEDLIPKGCNIEGYPNYNSANFLPCDDENGDGILNDCCGEFSEGCTDSDADNYVGDDAVASTAACEDCCIAEVGGCTDCGANNYEPSATDDDGSCTYDTAGCIDSSACCNIAEHASNDCSNVSGGDDTSCCSSTVYTTCYLDLNNNQIWEETVSNVSTCDCGDYDGNGEADVGWVSEEFISDGPEVVGCTEPVMSGADIGNPDLDADENYICSEYGQSGEGDEYANVDDGSCCINDPQPMSGFEEGSAELMLGTYNVIIQLGYTEGCNEDCCADADLTAEEFGHDGPETRVEIMALGLNGTFQHHEAKIDSISMRPEWEYHLEGVGGSDLTEQDCENEASEADYWYCENWGHDYENCEDFTWENDCKNNGCNWETHFCQSIGGGGKPCHEYNNENECFDLGDNCNWDYNQGTCFTQNEIPGMQCFGMNQDDCGADPDCMLESAFIDCATAGGYDGSGNYLPCDCNNANESCYNVCCSDGGGDGGFPTCITDCAGFETLADNSTELELCTFITTNLYSGGFPNDCIADCNDEYIYGDDGSFDGTIMDSIEELNLTCGICMSASDPESMCAQMWDSNGGNECDGCDCGNTANNCYNDCCEGFIDCSSAPEYVSCNDYSDEIGCHCDSECFWDYGTSTCASDPCLSVTDMGDCLDGESNPGCDWVNMGEFGCQTPDGCCVMPPPPPDQGAGCLGDCPDIGTIAPGSDATADFICEYITDIWGGAGDHDCVQDCSGDEYTNFFLVDAFCEACLVNPIVDCEDIFNDDGYGYSLDPHISLPDEIAMQLNKMQGMSQLNNSLSRFDDCSFDEGYLENCADFPEMQCCPADWVNDGFCDGPQQEWGCDLTCYKDSEGNVSSPEDNNLDGGDCNADDVEAQSCMPVDPCYGIGDEYTCREHCQWNENEAFCHPRPLFGADQCGMLDESGCNASAGLCMWEGVEPPNPPDNWEAHCRPYQEDCHQYDSHNIGACEQSPFCEWNPPETMQDGANGACMTSDPCGMWFNETECADQQGLHPDAACQWDDSSWTCVSEVDDSGSFCKCYISHSERSCNEGATATNPQSWETAPWCDGDDGCDEMLCMVSMEAHDCSYEHFEFDDPCAESTENMHLNIDWDGETCVVNKSRDNSGLWDVTGGQFCVAFPYEPPPLCEEINNPDECYCYDCEWNWVEGTDGGGACVEWTGRVRGREKRLEQERNYQNVMYSLSNSCSDADLQYYEPMTFSYSYPYTHNVVGGTIENGIYLWSVHGDEETCTEVLLVPVTGDFIP